MEKGWKFKKEKTDLIVGTEAKPTQFKSGEVIINKKSTKKHLDKLIQINNDGINKEPKGKVTNDATEGGLLKGKPHYDENGNPTGGIPGIVDGVKKIETEGDEFVVNAEASRKHWQELSKINQEDGNGVAIGPQDANYEEDPEEEYKGGGKIEFNANHIPSKWVMSYAKKIKSKYPEIWKLGGNIFGNQAFENLERVFNRGYWLDSEKWMYIKWRSYVARHQRDYHIGGVVAMLKWVDKVEKGWPYMKELIEAKIAKKGWKHKQSSKKMKDGGNIESENKPKNLEDNIFIHETKKEYFENILKKGFKLSENPVITKGIYTVIEKDKKDKFYHDGYEIAIKLKEGSKIFWTDTERPTDFIYGITGNKYFSNVYKKWYELTTNHPFEKRYEMPQDEKWKWREKLSTEINNWLDENKYCGIQQGGEIVITNLNCIKNIKPYNRELSSKMSKGGVITYKDKYNTKYGYKKGESHSLEQIHIDSGVSMKGLQQIYDKGIGAYKTNPSSVRPNVTSKEQWAMARVYSSVMGGKAAKIDAKELKMENGGNIDEAISKLKSVTSQQKNTIKRIVSTIEKANGKQTVSVLDIRKGHVILNVFNVRDKVDVIRTTTFCDVEINTKGNITKGFYNYLTPKVETKYPYMEKGGGVGQEITCQNCGWHWNTNQSEEFDKYVCHNCGTDNSMVYAPKKHVEGGLVAPNGKSSNLTPEQYKLVRTTAFKAWFGDWENDFANASKVIDENGEPLVVEHKTNSEFYIFDKNKSGTKSDYGYFGKGFYFSPKGKGSKSYGDRIMYCFLNLKNPKYIKSYELEPNNFIEAIVIRGDFDFIENKKLTSKESKEIQEIVVFEPNQIKLADGTNTTFDGNNPDIRFEEGGIVNIVNSKSLTIEIGSDLYKVQYQRNERGDTDKNVWFANVMSKNGETIENGHLCYDYEYTNVIYGFSLYEVEKDIVDTFKENSLYLIIQDDYGLDIEVRHIESSNNPDIRFDGGGKVNEKKIRVKVEYLEEQFYELNKEIDVPVSVFKQYQKTGKVPREFLNDLTSEIEDKNWVETNPMSVHLTLVNKMEHGGNIEWSKAKIGDNALVVSENKMGIIVKDYGRKFHLKFVDGTQKTHDASELNFYSFDEEDYGKGGTLMVKGKLVKVGDTGIYDGRVKEDITVTSISPKIVTFVTSNGVKKGVYTYKFEKFYIPSNVEKPIEGSIEEVKVEDNKQKISTENKILIKKLINSIPKSTYKEYGDGELPYELLVYTDDDEFEVAQFVSFKNITELDKVFDKIITKYKNKLLRIEFKWSEDYGYPDQIVIYNEDENEVEEVKVEKIKLSVLNKIKKLSKRIIEIEKYNLGDEDDIYSYKGDLSFKERRKLFEEQRNLENELTKVTDNLSKEQCFSINDENFQALNNAGDYGYEDENEVEEPILEEEVIQEPIIDQPKIGKMAYEMTLDEYQAKVSPIIKDYRKFIKKYEKWFAASAYNGLLYVSLEEVIDALNSGISYSNFRLPSKDDWTYRNFTPEQQARYEYSYRKTRKFDENYTQEPTPQYLIDEKNNYINKFKEFFTKDEIESRVEQDELKSNKRSVRRAIDNGTYAKMLELGEITIERLNEIGDSVGVRIPRSVLSPKDKLKAEFDEKKRKALSELPTISVEKMDALIESILKDLKPLESEIYIKERKRILELFSKVTKLQEISVKDLAQMNLPQINVYVITEIRVIKEDRKTIDKFVKVDLNDNWEKELNKALVEFVESLKYKIIFSIINNFDRITVPISEIKRLGIKVGEKGFEGQYKFIFENGCSFIFETQSIPAGGYNIQAYHFRFLSNFIDVKSSTGEKIPNNEFYKYFNAENYSKLENSKEQEFKQKIESRIIVLENLIEGYKKEQSKRLEDVKPIEDINEAKTLPYVESFVVKPIYDGSQNIYQITLKEGYRFEYKKYIGGRYKQFIVGEKKDTNSLYKALNNVQPIFDLLIEKEEKEIEKLSSYLKTTYNELLIAPNGEVSNLDKTQYALVRTKAFKNWFGDWENDPENSSKVIDENGEPKVLYRGFPKRKNLGYTFKYNVNLFGSKGVGGRQTNKFGFYFTDNKKVAESYANNLTETDKEQVIQSYFLNIRKLADIFDKNYKYDNDELGWDFNEELGYNQYISKEDISLQNILDSLNLSVEDFKNYVLMLNRSLYNDINRHKDYLFLLKHAFQYFVNWNKDDNNEELWRKILFDLGYDGICFYEGTHSYSSFKYSLTYACFNSNQIKLADGTNINFDPEKEDVRFDQGGNVDSIEKANIKIDKLPNGKLFDDAKNIEGIFDRSKYSWSEVIENFEKNKNSANLESINIKDIHITQPNIQSNKVKSIIKNIDSIPVINVIQFKDGEKAIYDGHHRLVANWALGNNLIKVNLVKVNDYFNKGGGIDQKDTVTLDIPLLIRTLELAREDIKNDEELHRMVERLLNLKNKKKLTMDDYEYIAKIQKLKK